MKLDYMQRIQLGIGLVKQQHGSGIAVLCEVSHDDDCKIHTKKKKCTCIPDILLKTENEIKYIVDEDGVPSLRV